MRTGAARRIVALGAAVAGALGVSAAVAFGPAPTAGADPVGQCTTTSGVIVAVDFSPWGGAVERGCALAPTDGLGAMGTAGFLVAQVSTEPGFVCRITDPATGTAQPATVAGNCNVTPPASAYWSYWHAGAGADTWTYSPLGAASATPGPGSVDAWVFGAGSASNGQPSFTPDAVRATNPTPVGGSTATTAAPSTAGTAPITGGGSSSTGSTPTTAVPTGGDTPATAPPPTALGGAAPSTTTIAGGAAPPATPHHGSPRVVDVTPAQAATVRTTAPAGSPLPLVVGAVVVALLAGGTWLAVRRRRRRTV